MKKPIPNTPARLAGSFQLGEGCQPETILENLLKRAEMTADPVERLMQAQRAIGALMGFTALGHRAAHIFLHRDVFKRLADLTGMNQNDLVACAGIAR
jgi:hypothetical protein